MRDYLESDDSSSKGMPLYLSAGLSSESSAEMARGIGRARGAFRPYDNYREDTHSNPIMRFLIKRQVVLASIWMVMTDVFLTINYKRLIDHTTNYTMVTVPVLMIILFHLFTVIFLICKIKFPEYMARPFNPRPLVKLAVMDIISSALSAIGSSKTSGHLLPILGQVGIPLTMVASMIIFGESYSNYQYLGAFLVVLFVVVKEVSLPGSSETNDFKYNILYLASNVPDSVSATLRSGLYASKTFHLVKYHYMTNILQMVMGIPMYTVLVANTRTRPDLGVISGTLHDIKAGIYCLFVNRNTIVEQCGQAGSIACDACEGSFKVLGQYLLSNIMMRLASIVLMMNGAVTLIFMLGAIKVPLCSIAFSMSFISGESTTELNGTDVVCFLGMMLAIILYGLGSRKGDEALESDPSEPMLVEYEASDNSLFPNSFQLQRGYSA